MIAGVPIAAILIWAIVLGYYAYLLLAYLSIRGFAPPEPSPWLARPEVTILKPLCGSEPNLEQAIASFLSQQLRYPHRFVFGAADPDDPGLAVARKVAAGFPDVPVRFVADPELHGTNPKVSNLINMSKHGLGEVVVISDSDVIAPPGALDSAVATLASPQIGAVTCLYRGRPGRAGDRVQSMGCYYLDGWYRPTALLHARLAGNQVCFGPLTAIRRSVVDAEGGFQAIANSLADDTELGQMAVRQGLRIAFAPEVVETLVNDQGLAALTRHELRWARTIRALEPVGYLASIFMHPGPLPLLLVALVPGPTSIAAVVGLALARWGVVAASWRVFGRAEGLLPAGPITLWLRDQLTFGIWAVGLFGSRISWRGQAMKIGARATLKAPMPAGTGGGGS